MCVVSRQIVEDDREELRDLVIQIAPVVGRTSVPPRKASS